MGVPAPVGRPGLGRPAAAACRRSAGPPCSCCPPCSPPQIVQVDAEQLEAEILSRDRPLIIDFYATWCGPCVLLAKELETVRRWLGGGLARVCASVAQPAALSTWVLLRELTMCCWA